LFGELILVRVTEHFLGCISFLCIEDPREERLRPAGTAFAVSVPDPIRPAAAQCYLVTARHNLELALTDRIFVRVNTDEGVRDILTDRSDWQKHHSADVACLLLKEEYPEQIPLNVFVGGDFPNHFRFTESGANFPVSVGTELFFVGLFVQAPGRRGNLPIARFGHVSRMPSEVILSFRDESYSLEQVAYLAECGSWGGDSGSPAFCVFYRTEDNGTPRRYIAFLGLISGHYDNRTEVKALNTEEAFEAAVNSGIAIITPAEFVRELLFREDVVEERNNNRSAT
jgi:hypothetical protein